MTPTPQTDPLAIPAGLVRSPAEPGQKTAAQTATEAAAKPAPKLKATNTAAAPKAAKPAKAKKAKAVKSDDEALEDKRRTVVPVAFKKRYAATNDTSGTRLALHLKAATSGHNAEGRVTLDVDKLRQVAKANAIDFAPYEKLNNGMKRMNVGNKLAGLVKGGTTVDILGKKFTDKTAFIKDPPKEAPVKKAKAAPAAEQHAQAA